MANRPTDRLIDKLLDRLPPVHIYLTDKNLHDCFEKSFRRWDPRERGPTGRPQLERAYNGN